MKRPSVCTLVLALVLVLGGAAALILWRTPAPEAAELLSEGGEIVLREPMNPIRGETRVLLVALDGVGDGELQDIMAAGRMPRLSTLLGPHEEEGRHRHGYAVPGVLSVLPSTTWAVWPAVFTGRPVSETGVSGNEWYVREEMAFYAPGPISITETDHVFASYTRGLLGQAIQVPTLFEALDLRIHVSLLSIHRGADLLTVPALSDVAAAFGAVAEGFLDDGGADRSLYGELDAGATQGVLSGIERYGVPDLQVVYFPGIDLFTHVADPSAEEAGGMTAYLEEVIDPSLGRILDAYAEAGALESTYVVIVSDHGHTPVVHDEHHALGSDPETGPPRLLESAGFRVRPATLEVPFEDRDYQAVAAYQGAMAYLYLADRSTCRNPGEMCSWMLPPRYDEDVLAVVRAADQADRFGTGVPELQGTLDLIFAREPRPSGRDALPFQVWNGEELIPLSEYLDREPRPDLPDLEERMRGLAEGPFGHRAGDVILLSKSGAERPLEERYYFSQPYSSWHGGPGRGDSGVALMVARSGAEGREIRDVVRGVVGHDPSQLHVAPLILRLLAEARAASVLPPYLGVSTRAAEPTHPPRPRTPR